MSRFVKLPVYCNGSPDGSPNEIKEVFIAMDVICEVVPIKNKNDTHINGKHGRGWSVPLPIDEVMKRLEGASS